MQEKKLLILDIDETLIYASEQPLERAADFRVGQYFVYKRPFLESFLTSCFANFDVAVWTTATQTYAKAVVEEIFNKEQALQFVWTRDRCTLAYDEELRENFWVKRMHKLRRRGYKLKSIIVIDDKPEVWRCSYGNLVRVAPFEGNQDDAELNVIPIFLEKLKNVENVRTIEKRNWRMRIN